MPPSIVITEPVPRWKAWAYHSLKAAALILLCALSFYAGIRYERKPQPGGVAQSSTVVSDAVDASSSGGAATVAPQIALAEPPADMLASLALEGLQIQSLEVSGGMAVPGELRYAFVVLNDGRLYEGSFELLVLGVQEGRAVQWVFPTESQQASGAYRLRVARYLKTEGKIQLPPGLVPQAVALSLREPAGVRARRGAVLADPGAAPGAPLMRPGQ